MKEKFLLSLILLLSLFICGCGEEIGEEGKVITINGIEYTIYDYGYVGVTGYTGNDSDIHILRSITYKRGQYEVEGVLRSAFQGNSIIRNVYIPSTVHLLDDSAFCDCKNLESVYLEGDCNLCDGTFKNCSNLRNFNHCNWDGSNATFKNCTSLRELIFSSEMTTNGYHDWNSYIMGEVCMGCTSLEKVEIPSGFDSIYDRAFFGCTSLKTITLPSTIKEISQGAFANSGLETVYCHASVPPRLWSPSYYNVEPVFNNCDYVLHVPTFSKAYYEAHKDEWGAREIIADL